MSPPPQKKMEMIVSTRATQPVRASEFTSARTILGTIIFTILIQILQFYNFS
jgi:hypothetical protein